MSQIVEIKNEINKELADKETLNSLASTTFKGLDQTLIKRAIMEGMMRGFTFKDFLEKNVYAIPFRNRDGATYSLVTSIDYARKLGMKSGVVGKSAPTYEMGEDGKTIISCSITIKRMVDGYVGEYTATVFWDEYNTGKNLWVTKPRTMIAKVAESHALRMACPEELAKSYIEEELEYEIANPKKEEKANAVLEDANVKLEGVTTLAELKKVWASLPIEAKNALKARKEELKAQFEKNENTDIQG